MYKKETVKPSFKIFMENLKNDSIKNVMLMYGEEQYLIKWAVESLVKKYVNDSMITMDYQIIDDDDAICDNIIRACETFSMLSEKRVVWVRNFKPLSKVSPKGYSADNIKKLADYVKKSNDATILVFSSDEEPEKKSPIVSASSEGGQCYEFSKLSKPELSSFAAKRFRNAGIEIEKNAMSRLIESTGYFNKESDYRLYNFENDIFKIIAHSDGKNVTEDDISSTVDGDMETFVFDMLDGISANQKGTAFTILYNMLHSDKEAYSIIGAIVSQFELMLEIKQLKKDGMALTEMHKKLGGSQWRIKKMIPYVNRYQEEKIKSILSNIYEVDRQIKTGVLGEELALELFIAKI